MTGTLIKVAVIMIAAILKLSLPEALSQFDSKMCASLQSVAQCAGASARLTSGPWSLSHFKDH
jgi:hypothetical protein